MTFFGTLSSLVVSSAVLAEGFPSRTQTLSVQTFLQRLSSKFPVDSLASPTGLLSHHSERRPGWGRDYGPVEMNLPKEMAKDPFGPDDTTPPPIAQPPGQVVQPTATPTSAPDTRNTSRVVKNPKREHEISPSDQTEKVKRGATDTAKIVDPGVGTMPESFPGSRCEEVCAQCEIMAAQIAQGECQCHANCLVGSIGGKCMRDRAGWTDNKDTHPYEEWNGFCSATEKGDFNCTQCLSEDFMGQLTNCTNAGSGETMCLHKLRNKVIMNVGGKAFCTNTNIAASCQEFPKVPDHKGDGMKWICFDTLRRCHIEAKRLIDPDAVVYDHQTHSVWGQMDREPMIMTHPDNPHAPAGAGSQATTAPPTGTTLLWLSPPKQYIKWDQVGWDGNHDEHTWDKTTTPPPPGHYPQGYTLEKTPDEEVRKIPYETTDDDVDSITYPSIQSERRS